MISTLQKLAGLGNTIADNKASSINFNANLPITIEVLKQLGHERFKLKIGRKELTTKSQKNLKEGKKYWGNFFEGKGGILTISHLFAQPSLFSADFLDIPFGTLISSNFSLTSWKTFIIEHLAHDTTSKELFSILTPMLFAVNKSIVHLPLLNEGKKSLLQFTPDEKYIKFYVALENLGPIEGALWMENEVLMANICVMYEKSLHFLQKEVDKLGIITHLSSKREILPLYDFNDLLLDVKG